MKFPILLFIAFAATVNAQPQVVVNQVVETFNWKNPFAASPTPSGFEARCESTKTFHATQHVLRDLQKPTPLGLAPWADALKFFFGGRPFPGSWEGVDATGMDRDVIMMEYKDVPDVVKDWIEQQQEDKEGDTRWLFAVYDKPGDEGVKVKGTAKPRATDEAGHKEDGENKVMLFAAGALYDTLPLWVAEGSDCQVDFIDLENYNAGPKQNGVVAWVVERTEPDYESVDRDITFTIKAQFLKKAKEAVKTADREKDEL